MEATGVERLKSLDRTFKEINISEGNRGACQLIEAPKWRRVSIRDCESSCCRQSQKPGEEMARATGSSLRFRNHVIVATDKVNSELGSSNILCSLLPAHQVV